MFGYANGFGVLLLTVGCRSSIVLDKPTAEDSVVDYDRDGFSSDVDCDDWDPVVNPDGDESCDGIDNNCDGQIDEGVNTQYFLDADNDGFGDGANSLTACEAPSGYITVENDCDDGNAQIHPGATEICDEIDNDCDGAIDEDLLGGLYLDADGDGYGDPNVPIEDCTGDLSQSVANELDCNDQDPSIHFNAVELCDEIDNDCDGAIDEAGSGSLLWYADADGDGFGDPATSTSACAQPLGYVNNNDDCDDGDDTKYPYAEEVCNSQDDDCDLLIDNDPVDPTS